MDIILSFDQKYLAKEKNHEMLFAKIVWNKLKFNSTNSIVKYIMFNSNMTFL